MEPPTGDCWVVEQSEGKKKSRKGPGTPQDRDRGGGNGDLLAGESQRGRAVISVGPGTS